MRIYYFVSHYISHRHSGLDYIDCLRRLGHEIILEPDRADDADLVILHEAPERYPSILEHAPGLRNRPIIAICVWENEILPGEYITPLRLVDEIWTPSRFSRQSMLPHFPNTKLLPHLVRRIAPSARDLEFARGLLDKAAGGRIFFSIVDAINPRKNVQWLLKAFFRLTAQCDIPIRLALKQYRVSMDFSSLPGVINIEGDLSEGQMAALHVLSDAYVSAHHSEGWGLGLSQAMAYGKPVIATGYSGNMDYMDGQNSFPIRYAMVPVSEEMAARIPLFTTGMRWAEPDEDDFVAAMLRVAKGGVPAELPERASLIRERFGTEAICGILKHLLEEVAG